MPDSPLGRNVAAKVSYTPGPQITLLLNRWVNGDEEALDELVPHVYRELRRIARGYLRRESRAETLEPTALVNEAWLRVIRQPRRPFLSRAQFYGIAARVMRQILVDNARARQAAKRGPAETLPLTDAMGEAPGRPATVIALDEALARLSGADERKSKLVEMRYFGGMTAEEIAECTNISVNLVRRELRLAQAWLLKELSA